jgi:photosystem II stability/assembly factor-like uncharacterized protein
MTFVSLAAFSHHRALNQFLLVACFLAMVIFSGASYSLDLNLPDRLEIPAKHFDHLEKTAFLDVQKLSERLIAVGERGVIAFSDDSGRSWQQSDVPASILLTAIHFPEESEGWAVGHSGSVLHSKDQGQTWQLQLDGWKVNELLLQKAKDELSALKIQLEQADENQASDLQYAVEDAEFALSNAEYDAELGPANPFLDVLFLNNRKGFAIGAYGLFVMTEDGGQTWKSVASRLENFDRYHLNALTQLKGGTIIIAGEAGTLFVSYDQGDQWETLYGPYQGSFFGIQGTVNEDEALLYGLKGHVFKTQNGGQSWKRIQLDIETSLTSSSISDEGVIVLAGFSGALLISNDQGESFTQINTSGFEGFNGVAFSDADELILISDESVQTVSID